MFHFAHFITRRSEGGGQDGCGGGVDHESLPEAWAILSDYHLELQGDIMREDMLWVAG